MIAMLRMFWVEMAIAPRVTTGLQISRKLFFLLFSHEMGFNGVSEKFDEKSLEKNVGTNAKSCRQS